MPRDRYHTLSVTLGSSVSWPRLVSYRSFFQESLSLASSATGPLNPLGYTKIYGFQHLFLWEDVDVDLHYKHYNTVNVHMTLRDIYICAAAVVRKLKEVPRANIL